MVVTEWNGTAGDWGLKRGMLLTMGNSLTCSRYQNMMHRYSDLIEFANRSNLSDSFGSGVLEPGPGWIYFTPTYYSQGLYQRAAGSYSLKLDRSGPLSFYLKEPDLDVTLSPDGKDTAHLRREFDGRDAKGEIPSEPVVRSRSGRRCVYRG